MRGTPKKGDRVRILDGSNIHSQHCKWRIGMDNVVGRTFEVESVDSTRECVKLKDCGEDYDFNWIVRAYNNGDLVKAVGMVGSEDCIHGGYVWAWNHRLGDTGTVKEVHQSGDIRVSFDSDPGGWWHPDWVAPMTTEEVKVPTPPAPVEENRGLDLLCGTASDGVVGGWECSERNFVRDG